MFYFVKKSQGTHALTSKLIAQKRLSTEVKKTIEKVGNVKVKNKKNLGKKKRI